MNIKKSSLLFISLVLLLALFANSSIAVTEGSQSMGGAFDSIWQMFGFLPELITMEKLLGGEDTASLFWAKFLVWLALFATFYFGASFVFKDRNNIAIVVSLSFSLIGALLIPKSILINALQTYGLVAGLLLWLVPVVAGFFIASMFKNHWVKAIIYGTAAWILFSINETVVKEAGFINDSFPYFSLLFAATFIAFVWNLIGIGWGAAGQSGAAEWAGNRLGGAWDRVNQASEHGIFNRGRGRDHAEQTVEEVQRLEQLNRRLDEVRGQLSSRIRTTQGQELNNLQEIAGLMRQLFELQREIEALRRGTP